MFSSLATVQKQAGCLAIIAVALWLGGFGCSLCCVTGATDSCCLSSHESPSQPTSPTVAVSSCGAAACSCCKKPKPDSKAVQGITAIRREGAVGCSLLPLRLEGVTVQVRVADARAAQGELTAPPIARSIPARTISLLEAPPPLNPGGTFLRCCVLLISKPQRQFSVYH